MDSFIPVNSLLTENAATGRLPRGYRACSFLVFSQNHDQIGNRLKGDRLSRNLSFEALKLAAAMVLLSPYLPLLFMGEEYGETAPFQYFVSHSDPDLIKAVRKGRREEFAAFGWKEEPPDPQSEETFFRSRLNWKLSTTGKNKILRDFYQELIRLRKELIQEDVLIRSRRVRCFEKESVLEVIYDGPPLALLILSFGEIPLPMNFSILPGRWCKRMDSGETTWEGPGSRIPATLNSDGNISFDLNPHSCLLLVQDKEN